MVWFAGLVLDKQKAAKKMAQQLKITTPLTDEDVVKLRAGDKVLITGVLYTARDAAHKRLIELVNANKPLPFDVKGQLIYYVGPTPPKPGAVIGSAGPTTSGRMDAYTPKLLEMGLKGTIGKGLRSKEVLDAMKKHKAVYFGAVGGAAALIARTIKKAEVIAYDDLGPEAIRRLEVVDFPAIVVNDAAGGDLFSQGVEKWRRTGCIED
jgi:fumarate hydratase subunit beta